jgi:hypothetical protein
MTTLQQTFQNLLASLTLLVAKISDELPLHPYLPTLPERERWSEGEGKRERGELGFQH